MMVTLYYYMVIISLQYTGLTKLVALKTLGQGALMRLFGVVEMSTKWCFKANYIEGVENTLADTISRGSTNDMLQRLTLLQPNIHWQQVTLSQQTLNIITEALVSDWQPRHWGRELWSLMTITGDNGVISAIDVTETTI
jgi:hypothetical protein